MNFDSDIGAHHSATLCMVNSGTQRHETSELPSNVRMKVISDIRRLRLGQLKDESGASWADIARKLGRSSRDSTLSQVWHQAPDSKTGKPRSMGEDQARALEIAFGKPTGWMDQDPDVELLLNSLAADRGLVALEPSAAYGLPGLSTADLAELDPQRRQEVANYIRERLALQRLEKFSNAAEPLGKRSAA